MSAIEKHPSNSQKLGCFFCACSRHAGYCLWLSRLSSALLISHSAMTSDSMLTISGSKISSRIIRNRIHLPLAQYSECDFFSITHSTKTKSANWKLGRKNDLGEVIFQNERSEFLLILILVGINSHAKNEVLTPLKPLVLLSF